jgi:hypothetical protein
MDEDFVCLALAMYCTRDAFDADHAARGEACDFDAMQVAAGVSVSDATDVSDVSIDIADHDPGWDASNFDGSCD